MSTKDMTTRLHNPMFSKTYSPNSEPWLTAEEMESYLVYQKLKKKAVKMEV